MKRLSHSILILLACLTLCVGFAYADETTRMPTNNQAESVEQMTTESGEHADSSASGQVATEGASSEIDEAKQLAQAQQEEEERLREAAEQEQEARRRAEEAEAEEAARATEEERTTKEEAERAARQEAAPAPSSVQVDKTTQGQGEAEKPDAGLEAQQELTPTIRYCAHVQRQGWQAWRSNGELAGTSGQSLRMEGFQIELADASNKKMTGVSYQAHVQRIGWQGWVNDGALAGTTGQSLRVEAIRIKLSDALSSKYDVWYRLHVQRYGWLGWAKNGESAGTEGRSLRAESIYICITEKGKTPSGYDGSDPFVDGSAIALDGHVQRVGWVSGANSVGTVGQSLRLEAIKARITRSNYSGSIIYNSHVQSIGWQGEVADGGLSGTTGLSRRVEAITVRLEGEIANHYDVWYRLHIQTYGWLSWAKNGEQAGSAGLSRRCESIEISLQPKGFAPSNAGSSQSKSFITAEDVPAETGAQSLARANAAQRALVQSAYDSPSAPAGYCAQWVEDVYANAGYGRFYGDACDLYDEYCHSSDLNQLKAGMIVCVSTHPHSSAGSIWGHVGVYVGDNTVRDSVYGYVRTSTLSEWMSYYGASVPVRWGWLGNINIA